MSTPVAVFVRSVWASNLVQEIDLIGSLLDRFPYIAVDTEYPGIYFDHPTPHYLRTPEDQYAVVKNNVENLKIIQLGLTLSDADGNMPYNGSTRYVWEFNFSDFDLSSDTCMPQSIKLLQDSGIDLSMARKHGIPTSSFARAFLRSRLAAASRSCSWITFHGSYDMAYLMKAITGKKLPETLKVFLAEVKRMFGNVYDIKSMMLYCNGLYGGLENVAKMLHVERAAGRRHQAGSDSFVIGSTFVRLRKSYFSEVDVAKSHAGRLYGLHYLN